MRNHKKFGRRIFDNYGGSTRHYDIQDEYGYTNANRYRNSDYDDRNFWHNDNELYGNRDNYRSNYANRNRRGIYTDLGHEEGGYNPNLNDGYYGEESRGYRGRGSYDYNNSEYGEGRHYRPEDYDRGARRNNYHSNRYNDYANLDHRSDYNNRTEEGYTERRQHSNARPYYNDYESYPSYNRSRTRRNFSGRRHNNSEYYDRSYRKNPYYHDSRH